MARQYDIIVFGAGVAGLWLAGRLKRAGYNVIVIEKEKAGAGQTIASQGMIHGGQKYALGGNVSAHAGAIRAMPDRWESCLGGWGEIDLTSVRVLSESQVMWPAGSLLSEAALIGAAKLVNAQTKKLGRKAYPQALQEKKKFKGPVYELPEKVIDAKSLLAALTQHLKGRVLQGTVSELLPDGQAAVSGEALQAQLIVFAAGAGNEDALKLMRIKEQITQRRPLRQVMVKSLPYALYGHGITVSPKPRITITSYPVDYGEYIWYLGGSLAEQGAAMTGDETIAFAKKELAEIFPDVDWHEKEWATWMCDRAEPFSAKGDLPPGPALHQRGRVLLAWPSKLTFAPALADAVFDWMKDKDIRPAAKDAPPDFPPSPVAAFPWEEAEWKKC